MGSSIISVIIPVYNVCKYLDECIESIVSQTYDKLEIIIIDDGSTDGSGEICDKWTEKDSRIKVFHQENGGICSARNKGIKSCTGEYILFVDSDDYIENDMVEKLYNAIIEYDVDIAACYECAFDDGEIPLKKPLNIKGIHCENHGEYLEHFNEKFRGYVTWVWNKLYKRSLMNEVEFDEEHTKMEDIVFSALIAQRVEKCVWVNERLYYYRQRNKSIMHSWDTNLVKCFLFAILYEKECLYDEENKYFSQCHLKRCLSNVIDVYKMCNKNHMEEKQMCIETYRKMYYENINLIPFGKDKIKYFLYNQLMYIA